MPAPPPTGFAGSGVAPEFPLTPELCFQFLFLAVLLRRGVKEAGWTQSKFFIIFRFNLFMCVSVYRTGYGITG